MAGPTDDVVVATANAASGRDQRTGRPDLARWAAAAAGLGADVLAVQEVDHLLERSGSADQATEIARACAAGGPAWEARFAAAVHGVPGDRATFSPAATTVAGRPSYGVALVSRHPVEQWWEHRLAPSRLALPIPLPPAAPARVLWVPDEPRVVLAARVAAPVGGVTVVCTHLSFVPARAVRQLRQLVTWAAPLPRPLVLLGDLNLPGRVPARLTGWTPALRARTYPATQPRVQLDHVLVDDPDGVLAVGAAGTVVLGEGDHLAVRAALTGAAGA